MSAPYQTDAEIAAMLIAAATTDWNESSAANHPTTITADMIDGYVVYSHGNPAGNPAGSDDGITEAGMTTRSKLNAIRPLSRIFTSSFSSPSTRFALTCMRIISFHLRATSA